MTTVDEAICVKIYSTYRYLCYLARHKWFVFLGCCQAGVPLLGILHDLSKFRPSEWFPYLNGFYLEETSTTKGTLDFSILLHYRRNKHHWQWWVRQDGNGDEKADQMERKYVLEMVADWRGAGRTKGNPDTVGWYRQHMANMVLHPDTRVLVESLLRIGDNE